ncbi:hypothetical protein D3C78_1449100 [compost metagenome]
MATVKQPVAPCVAVLLNSMRSNNGHKAKVSVASALAPKPGETRPVAPRAIDRLQHLPLWLRWRLCWPRPNA